MKQLKLSLVMPTYNERATLRKSILDFEKTRAIDEIIIIDNNATFDVLKTTAGTSAKVVPEVKQGYGAAIQKGLRVAKGDLIVICEPDGTFVANDIFKLLSYSKEFQFVIGTRTVQELIWEGANMGFLLKWGNYVVAKLVQFLFNTVSLSDVGCTYRIIHKKALEKIRRQFRANGGDFSLEMMVLACKNNLSIIQIPVNYKERPTGESTYSGTLGKALKLGTRMIIDIITIKLRADEA